MDTVSEFHAEAPQAIIASEGLAQGPCVAAGAGLESMTLWTKGCESTNEPPHPTFVSLVLKKLVLIWLIDFLID